MMMVLGPHRKKADVMAEQRAEREHAQGTLRRRVRRRGRLETAVDSTTETAEA